MTYLTPEQINHLANLKAAGYTIKIRWRFQHGDYHLAKFMSVQQIWFDDEGMWFHTDVLFKIDAKDVTVDEITVSHIVERYESEWVYDWESIEVSTGGQDA